MLAPLVILGGIYAGFFTPTEAAAVGLPAVFVPLPIGNGEQAMNAKPVVDAGGGLMVEQTGGGDQLAAVHVTHADMAAVNVVVVHVQTPFGAVELGVEFRAEYAVAQGLRFTQGGGALQAFGLQSASGLSHARSSVCRLGACSRSILLGKLRLGSGGVITVTLF